MAYSIQREVSDGALVLLDISISYIERSEISVYFDDVLQTEGATWTWVGVSDAKISFSPTVANGVEVTVKRVTDLSDLRHRYSNGAAFTANSMDESFEQVLHIAQEAAEGGITTAFYANLNMHGHSINNLADAVEPQQAVTYKQLLDVAYGAVDVLEEYIAAEGQTVFTLTQEYVVGAENLAVFVNGLRQARGTAYTESTSTTVTFTEGLAAGDNIQFVWGVPSVLAEVPAERSTYLPAGAGAVTTTVQNKLREVVSVKDFGAVGDGITDDTAAIQAAIDSVYTAGGGMVYMPEGTYAVSATASPESWEVYAAGAVVQPLPSGSCCLIIRNRVYLRGAGMNTTTILLPSNTSLDGIYLTNSPNGYGISDLTIDGQWDLSSEVNSHGIFWVTTTIADEANTLFSDGEIRNVRVRRVSSYGFGLQNGGFRGNLFDNIRTELTGADGFDAKNRQGNKGNRITNATISAFGLRGSLTAQAGIDVRGEGWAIIAPRVINFGVAGTIHTGIRLNPGGGTNGTTAEKSYVTDFIVTATNTNTRGVESYGPECSIGPGSVEGCAAGIFLRSDVNSSAIDNTVTGVTVDGAGADGNAFISENSSVLRARWVGCSASNIQQGWRPSGTDEVLVGCAIGSGVTTGLSKSGSPIRLTVTSSPLLLEETRSPAFLSDGPFSVADDAVVFVSTGTGAHQQFGLIGQASAGAGFPNGLFIFRSNASPQCSSIAVQTSTNVTFTTGILTGTTGVDGNFTISAVNGGLYFENRTGSTKQFVLTFFGER